jgi:hypothetical protein
MHRVSLLTLGTFHRSLVRTLAGCALVMTATGVSATPPCTSVSPEVSAEPSGEAELSWLMPTANVDETALSGLAGVLIYYGTSPSELTRCVVVSGEYASSYTVTGLSAGTWYFGVEAFTTDGAASQLSGIVSKEIL